MDDWHGLKIDVHTLIFFQYLAKPEVTIYFTSHVLFHHSYVVYGQFGEYRYSLPTFYGLAARNPSKIGTISCIGPWSSLHYVFSLTS